MAHVQWGVGGDKHVHKWTGFGIRHTQLASYVLTCRLGLGCIGNTGCYTVQWGQLGLGRIDQKYSLAVTSRTGGGLNIHVLLPGQGGFLRGFSEGHACTSALQPTGYVLTYNDGRRRARTTASRSAFCGTRSALP